MSSRPTKRIELQPVSDSSSKERVLTIALAGNPNAGKTTLFNALAGTHYKVGNYPGVTVERREGRIVHGNREYRLVDLPGIYSLTAYSIDEVVARDFLLDDKPDLIVDVLDSANLERHLYLCLQFQELGIPVMGALNMSDEAEAKGLSIDADALGAILGMPMVKTVGTKDKGVQQLMDAIALAAVSCSGCKKTLDYGAELEERLGPLVVAIEADTDFASRYPARWLAVKLLEKDAHAKALLGAHAACDRILAMAADACAWVEKHYGKDTEIVVSEQRYGYIHGSLAEAVVQKKVSAISVTEAVDRVVMNRFLALPIFLAVLWAVFQLTFTLGSYPMAWLESGFSALGSWLHSVMPESLIRSLLADGIVGGVGGVMSFVPLIVLMFFFLSILEDLGYMSRAAFATDKFLHAFGLHGQSVFPMMLGFGCSVPAIMAARTLKNPRDRIVTILIIPFMSCGAKLPVHALLAAAFFPANPAAAVMAVYAIGVLLALCSAWLLKRTALKGQHTPFVMELPPYRAPTLRGVLWHVWEKTGTYLKKAGTVILLSSVLVWAATVFPVYRPISGSAVVTESLQSRGQIAVMDSPELVRLQLEYSWAGRLGRFIEPVFRPLGFDWRVGVATITGFAAKEVVVSTLGVLYDSGDDESLRQNLRKDRGFSPLVAFALMLFILVIPPCLATLVTIRSELGYKWLLFSLAFNLLLGWLLAFAVYNVGSFAGFAT
ncbi:MAG TPA: ferrous iron transport protein B [Spirochaetales bacterium]|nr:ferrous iron transport protein B [Spirochaetales bacterium]